MWPPEDIDGGAQGGAGTRRGQVAALGEGDTPCDLGRRGGAGVSGVRAGASAVLEKPLMQRIHADAPGVTLPVPGSLMSLLAVLAPLFTTPSFRTFCGLACG